MANEVYFLNEKIYDLGLEKSLLNKASKLINKVESLNEDYKSQNFCVMGIIR